MSNSTSLSNRPLLPVDWDYNAVAERRERYLSPALKTFTNYDKPILIKSGSMQYLFDEQGKKYLDCISQNLTVSVGHRHPAVMQEVYRQLEDLQHCSTMYHHPAAAHAAEELVQRLPRGVDWVVHYLNSGSEAVDLAMMMARVFTRNSDIITLRQAFHGLQFTAMAATGMAACRQPIAQPPGFLHTESPDAYRGPSENAEPYLRALDNLLETSSSGAVAALLIEPILGYGGVHTLPYGYMRGAFERIRALGGLCIVDEVQTGFARMGSHYWGFAMHGVVPDMIVMGKGISNGFPMSAVAVRRDVAQAMTKRRFFNTYGSNPISCAASRAVLDIIDKEDLQANAAKVSARFFDHFDRLRAKHDVIGDVRGHGLMIGIELVTDRAAKTPAPAEAARVGDLARDGEIIVGRSGPHKNVLRISPPLCLDMTDADDVASVLDDAFAQL